jgi:hypothetical protein
MNDEQKQLWRNRWLNCINELTSLDLQRKSWLDKSNTNPHWTFVEFMCSYFDDLGFEKNYENEIADGWISESEFESIRIWHKLLDKYDSPSNDDYDVEAILADKEWQMIVEKGKNAKIELSRLLRKEEYDILNEEIDYTKYM